MSVPLNGREAAGRGLGGQTIVAIIIVNRAIITIIVTIISVTISKSPKEDKPCVTSGCCTLHRTHSWKWNLLPASLRQEKDIPVIRDQKHRFDIYITSHVSGWSQMWFEKRLAGLDTWTETCLGSGRMGGQQKSRDDWMAVLICFIVQKNAQSHGIQIKKGWSDFHIGWKQPLRLSQKYPQCTFDWFVFSLNHRTKFI